MTDISKKTYVVQHSPNCPSPFLVRLVGYRKGVIDMLLPRQSGDAIGYGKSLSEAAANAMDSYYRQVESAE